MAKMNKLEELGIKYGTDKIGKHNYLPVYYDLFKNRRNKVKKVLEIGVGEGAGLRMFRDFFPNAIIYGADNDPKRVFVDPPIQVFMCDQSRITAISNLLVKTGLDLDLIIDDGSHKPTDQFHTFYTIFSILKKGLSGVHEGLGEKLLDNLVYIIEDVSDESIFLPIKKEYPQAEMIKVGKRYDDRLIIIKK